MKKIDFRSDTVTQPTNNMRKAMFEAIVGDDVYNDDPTVKELEKLIADMLGKDAALFVPSGTFSNQLALLTHTDRGDEVICDIEAHVRVNEVGGAAVISAVNLSPLGTTHGKFNIDQVKGAIRSVNIHYPRTKVLWVESPINGFVVDCEHFDELHEVAIENDLIMHLDGARFFNATEYLKVSPREYAKHFDSISICLSKNLCAPVGSLLVGSEEFIEKARRNRKMLGGGLRQVGHLAAAGLVALKEMIPRLEEDHKNALYLASKLEQYENFEVIKDRLSINFVFVEIVKYIDVNIVKELEKDNIYIGGPYNSMMRFALHNDIKKEDIDKLISCLDRLLKKDK